jgi:hypothetical protein
MRLFNTASYKGGDAFLKKPFSVEKLARKVREVLGKQSL